MTNTKRMEELSISYINAVCAYKAVDFECLKHDDDGIDALIKKEVTRTDKLLLKSQINIQLKSTAQKLSQQERTFSYRLRRKNYDDLRRPSTVPSILCLLVLPNNEDQWVSQSVNELILRKCMYWKNLINEPDAKRDGDVTIHINKEHMVTPDSVIELLKRVAEDGVL
jgi:hypothetical protein